MIRRAAVVTAFLLFTSACPQTKEDPPPQGGSGGGTSTGGRGGRGGSGGSGGSGGAGGTGGATAGSGGSGGSGGGAMTPDAGGGDTPPAAGDCTPALPKSLFCDPVGKMPRSIKDTGIYPNAPDLAKVPASLKEYVPSPALWSDGMEKQRFILLPKDKKIDNTNRDQWVFPVGTVFVKTFYDDSGPGGKPRPIETRFIRKVGDASAFTEFDFYVYEWNADSTDATLLVDNDAGDPNKDKDVSVTVSHMVDGKLLRVNNGMPFMHTLPSRKACGDCHEENGMKRQTFIGFDELRLNGKKTPAAAKTQLQEFADAGFFSMALPANPATITDTSNDGGRMLRIKRFVFGNCVHCHNGGKVVDFAPGVFVENTVGKPVNAQSVVPPDGWLRVVPGKPEESVVYVQTRRTMLPMPMPDDIEKRLRPMPPVGVADVAADQDALKDLRDWIMSLPAR